MLNARWPIEIPEIYLQFVSVCLTSQGADELIAAGTPLHESTAATRSAALPDSRGCAPREDESAAVTSPLVSSTP
jgi:hypothetical protein